MSSYDYANIMFKLDVQIWSVFCTMRVYDAPFQTIVDREIFNKDIVLEKKLYQYCFA